MRTATKPADRSRPVLVQLPPPTLDSAYRGAVEALMRLKGLALDKRNLAVAEAAELALDTLGMG